MPRIAIALVTLTALVLGSGCVSKAELEEAQAQLAACEEEKAQAEATVITWEARFDRESSRWTEMEASISEAVPQALNELHTERERILDLVPQQVQDEVEGYLQEYFSTVMKGFELMSDDNAEIKLELKATQKALQALGTNTRNIGTAIDEAMADEKNKREALGAQLGSHSEGLATVIEHLVEFDQTRINCKGCPDRLKLNRKEREAIVSFHQQLMSELSDLQSRMAARPGAAQPVEGEDDEMGEGAS
jgi:uncharacterized protein YPO0396